MDALTHSLIALSGDDNVIVVRKPFVKFTGRLEAGMMLSQLLYWTPKSKNDGWIAKSDLEFSEELCLTQYGVRSARKSLEDMGVLEVKIKKFNGAPTTHYRLKLDPLIQLWTDWLNDNSDFAKSQNPSCENERSLTETTTENSATPPSSRAASESKPKSEKKPTPRAVKVFRSKAHRFPAKSWYEKIASVVGEDSAELEFWGRVVHNWVGRGYKPTNVQGMLECFKRRDCLEKYQPRDNGRSHIHEGRKPIFATGVGEWSEQDKVEMGMI